MSFAPVEGVGASGSEEVVVVIRADDVLEARDGVALRVSARHGAAAEVDTDGRVGIPVVQGVVPAPAVEAVGSFSAFDDVTGGVADEGVGMVGADDVLESAHGVAGGVPSAEGVGAKIDVDGGVRVFVQEHVASAVAREPVAARPALDAVVAGVPGKGVGVGRADDVVETGKSVAFGVSARGPASDRRGEVDVDAGIGAGVDDGVFARLSVQRVGALAAPYRIVAFAAEDGVRACSAVEAVGALAAVDGVAVPISDEGIGIAGAVEILESRDDVALRVAARGGGRGEVDRDPLRGIAAVVGKEVAASPSDERVGAFSSADGVVAFARIDVVRAGSSFDAVVAAGEGAAFGVSEDSVVAGTAGQGVVTGAAGEPVATGFAFDAVVVGASVEEVAAAAADEGVIACRAGEPVAAGAADEAVVAAGASASRHASPLSEPVFGQPAPMQ